MKVRISHPFWHTDENTYTTWRVDITDIVGKDIGLMIRAFAAALEDENLLVRRGALDLLLTAIRVDSMAIRKAHAEDKAIIMKAAVGVVLRRDISLNRRLYSWLLGPEERPDNPIAYYKEHALGLLYSTLKVSLGRFSLVDPPDRRTE